MKKQIVLDKGVIFSVIAIILGIVVFMWGSGFEKRLDNPITLKNMTEPDCDTLNYVDGEVTAYLKSWEYDTTMEGDKNDGTQRTTGVSGNHNILLTNYDIYTVPIQNGKFIRILAGKNTTKDALENFNAAVPFQGLVIKTSKPLNSEWYGKIDQFNTANIISDYMIMEFNGENLKSIKYIGLVLGLLGLFGILKVVIK